MRDHKKVDIYDEFTFPKYYLLYRFQRIQTTDTRYESIKCKHKYW